MADQPTHQGEPGGWPGTGTHATPAVPAASPPRSRPVLAAVAAVAGVISLAAAVSGLIVSIMPRHFTAAQQQAIMAWEMGKRWRVWPAGEIFPAAVVYRVPAQALDSPAGISLSARLVGIAPQASCAAAADTAAARVLGRYGCVAVLRATYTDATGALVATIGVAVLRGSHSGATAQVALPGRGERRSGVRAVPFPGTLTVAFSDRSRQVAASVAAGPYLVMYTAGYADGRPHLSAARDPYGDSELMSLSAAIAGEIAHRLGAPPVLPHCPGAPGC